MALNAQFETMGMAIGQTASTRVKLSEEDVNLHSKGRLVLMLISLGHQS